MASRGIDYGCGTTNINHETGIRYGVIPQNDVLQSWADASEADYGQASCSECGNEAVPIDAVPFDLDDCRALRTEPDHTYSSRTHDILRIPSKYRKACGGKTEWHDHGRDFACLHCARSFDSDDAYGEEPLGFYLDDSEYTAWGDSEGDIFVTKSPYYTYGPFCSPCAPGAVYIRDGGEAGAKAYCFAPDWFDYWRDDGVEPAGDYDGDATSCPYPVFRVADNVCVYRPTKVEEED
jgi:hypothetical protein